MPGDAADEDLLDAMQVRSSATTKLIAEIARGGNLLKYAYNLAPNPGDRGRPGVGELPENGTAGLPFITRDAQGRLFIEFVRRKAATQPAITYVVETGDNLNNLLSLDLSGASIVSVDANWERVTVVDPMITPQRFGRVRVTPF